MNELIFFAVIIFFSILESVARKRRAEQRGQQSGGTSGQLPQRGQQKEWDFEWAHTDDDDQLPTYDEDPAYDQRPSYDDQAVPGRAQRPSPAPARPAPSSQTMLPKDLLDELAGLAGRVEKERARARSQTVELPRQSPPIPKPAPRATVPGPRATVPGPRATVSAPRPTSPASTRSAGGVSRSTPRVPSVASREGPGAAVLAAEKRRVHLTHAGYGTDPSSRARSEQDDLDPLARFLSADATAIRRQLLSHRGAALHQAVVYGELLGLPLALRPPSDPR